MSQVITNAFETYWQGCLTDQVPVVLDEVVLADIPNLDITAPIDPNTGLPPQAQIVHRHPVDQRGRINNNAVAYSIVMDTTVGNFSFNAMYLINKASGMVGMIVYKGRETKTKTDQATGTTGNSLVKSMLMEYDQAATATVTTVEAGTWQIDYSARLLGMDEQLRLQAIACFGSSAFFGDGFKLINKAGSYKVQPGVAMVGGLRIQLDAELAVTVGAKPVGVWVDVHHAGTILSRWDNHIEFKTSTTELTDYTDSNGYRHYVAKLGVVEANATVTDKRPANESADLWAALEALRKQTEQSASDMAKALADHAKGRNHPSATTTEQGMVRLATVEEALAGNSNTLAVTPEGLDAVIGERFLAAGSALPATNIGPIWHDDYASWMTWQVFTKNGADYRGYASVDLGALLLDTQPTPRQGYIKSGVQNLSRTTYAALRAWAMHHGRMVAPAAWQAGSIVCADNADNSTFRVYDVRGEFIRAFDDARGADPARVFGSWQNGTHITGDLDISPTVHGIGNLTSTNVDPADGVPRQIFTINPTGQSTTEGYWGRVRPSNTALLATIKY
ncbi:phage tail-collar fiber domain-containing protein [Aeromonas enteropelogenes]|uniref:phage tail-collar fiber domain-containing protein n=1 Tax=Aeromonas enteropelogenes TaxID=29489 RepID=UPI000694B46B|nr:phage tail protein [Aeromonas enteropelogenes]UBH54822.1 phage tail protein [Aeromonas enteropelogenes]